MWYRTERQYGAVQNVEVWLTTWILPSGHLTWRTDETKLSSSREEKTCKNVWPHPPSLIRLNGPAHRMQPDTTTTTEDRWCYVTHHMLLNLNAGKEINIILLLRMENLILVSRFNQNTALLLDLWSERKSFIYPGNGFTEHTAAVLSSSRPYLELWGCSCNKRSSRSRFIFRPHFINILPSG